MSQRIFMGLPVPVVVGEQLRQEASDCTSASSTALYPLDKLHLTLAFVGEVDEAMCLSLADGLQRIAEDASSFVLQFKTIENFKPRQRSALLWALSNLPLELGQLYFKIQTLLVNLGFEKERRVFRPHVTLSKEGVPLEALQRPLKLQWEVGEMCLYHSDNGHYTVRQSYLLR